MASSPLLQLKNSYGFFLDTINHVANNITRQETNMC